MGSQAVEQTVRRTMRLRVSVERAFAVFTQEMGRWWPIENTFSGVALGQAGIFDTVVMEPRAGGRWFERTAAGEEIDWGRVVAFEPPRRLVLTWQITPQGQPEPDAARASDVEIRLVPVEPAVTEVQLEHRQFERHGPEGAAIWRKAMDSRDGWDKFLDRFAIATTPDGT
ncbi:MAG: SRPBCC family protein [Chloroflexota bacterium]